MEDTLRVTAMLAARSGNQTYVLILVLMEDTLREDMKASTKIAAMS